MYNELKEILSLLWKNDDKMDQDTLFQVQDRMTTILLKVAEKEKKTDDLLKSFPYLFEVL